MFGMLDYRAHKLFWMLSVIPNWVLRMIILFLFPFIAYAIGNSMADARIWQIAISLGCIIPMEIVSLMLVGAYTWIFSGIFFFFIDVEPAEGRTEDEARIVVLSGDLGRYLLQIEKNVAECTDECIERLAKADIFNIFWRSKLKERLIATRDYYQNNSNLQPTEYDTNNFLTIHGMRPSKAELIIGNKQYRGMVVAYGFLLFLILTNPIGS